jgi:hypothetical protein
LRVFNGIVGYFIFILLRIFFPKTADLRGKEKKISLPTRRRKKKTKTSVDLNKAEFAIFSLNKKGRKEKERPCQ